MARLSLRQIVVFNTAAAAFVAWATTMNYRLAVYRDTNTGDAIPLDEEYPGAEIVEPTTQDVILEGRLQ